MFQISNIGNKQGTDNVINQHYLKSNLSISYKRLKHKLFIIFNAVGMIPKIEIRFMSNKRLIDLSQKNFSIYNRLYRFLNFSFAKRIITINSRAYDLFYKNKFIKNEKYIVLLDEFLDDPQYVKLRGYTDKKKLKIHYEKLIKKLLIISKYFKKKVIICIHPNDNLRTKKKIFKSLTI